MAGRIFLKLVFIMKQYSYINYPSDYPFHMSTSCLSVCLLPVFFSRRQNNKTISHSTRGGKGQVGQTIVLILWDTQVAYPVDYVTNGLHCTCIHVYSVCIHMYMYIVYIHVHVQHIYLYCMYMWESASSVAPST